MADCFYTDSTIPWLYRQTVPFLPLRGSGAGGVATRSWHSRSHPIAICPSRLTAHCPQRIAHQAEAGGGGATPEN